MLKLINGWSNSNEVPYRVMNKQRVHKEDEEIYVHNYDDKKIIEHEKKLQHLYFTAH